MRVMAGGEVVRNGIVVDEDLPAGMDEDSLDSREIAFGGAIITMVDTKRSSQQKANASSIGLAEIASPTVVTAAANGFIIVLRKL